MSEEEVRRAQRQEPLGVRRDDVHVQAEGSRRYLLREEAGGSRYRLLPDVLVSGRAGDTRLILDTKWKRLGGKSVASRRPFYNPNRPRRALVRSPHSAPP